MPWSESRVDARWKFIQEFGRGTWTVTELARRHGISRKTAYKILGRYAEDGLAGLLDQSRARHRQDHETEPVLVRRIVATKRRYTCWGPRKILALLEQRFPELDWPACSTVGDILRRHGLVTPRRRRWAAAASESALRPASEPNDLWCSDFKGHRLSKATRERLEPFTLGDAFSRYSLACQLVGAPSTDEVWPILESAFRRYGLPRRFRSDNGTPFASPGLAGLSALTVRLLRLGIRPERIAPGKPQENGMLERFHLTLELEALSPPAPTRSLQEKVLQRFRRRYNDVRPHEALDDRPPAAVYEPSPRRLPRRLPEFEYEAHVPVRSVRQDGRIKWAGREFFLSETLVGERVGFYQSSSTHWSLRLGPHLEVALLDERTGAVLRHDRLVWLDRPLAEADKS